jgi:hypothetical protein
LALVFCVDKSGSPDAHHLVEHPLDPHLARDFSAGEETTGTMGKVKSRNLSLILESESVDLIQHSLEASVLRDADPSRNQSNSSRVKQSKSILHHFDKSDSIVLPADIIPANEIEAE